MQPASAAETGTSTQRSVATLTAVADEVGERVYRVTVRGRFYQLGDEARRRLVAAAPEHDIFLSAYTPEGTFTYDARIDFFNLRYEVRAGGPDPLDAANRLALQEAEAFLGTMRYGYRGLKVTAVDLSAIWDDVERRRN